jgi:hypothetical protein
MYLHILFYLFFSSKRIRKNPFRKIELEIRYWQNIYIFFVSIQINSMEDKNKSTERGLSCISIISSDVWKEKLIISHWDIFFLLGMYVCRTLINQNNTRKWFLTRSFFFQRIYILIISNNCCSSIDIFYACLSTSPCVFLPLSLCLSVSFFFSFVSVLLFLFHHDWI